MRTSETITKITPAFLAAQKLIEAVVKDKKNPYFGSTYSSQLAVVEACKKHLNDNDIAVLQPIDGMNVETTLIHTSGEWYSSLTPIKCKAENDPQALGSAVTYAKKIGLKAMVLLPDEDDDGNKATNITKEASTTVDDPTANWSQGEDEVPLPSEETEDEHICYMHKFEGKPIQMKDRGKGIWDHRAKLNEDQQFDKSGDWYYCQGHGYHLSKNQ